MSNIQEEDMLFLHRWQNLLIVHLTFFNPNDCIFNVR